MVEVCGGIQASRDPHTLWRPTATGSVVDAWKDATVSRTNASTSSRRRAATRAPER